MSAGRSHRAETDVLRRCSARSHPELAAKFRPELNISARRASVRSVGAGQPTQRGRTSRRGREWHVPPPPPHREWGTRGTAKPLCRKGHCTLGFNCCSLAWISEAAEVQEGMEFGRFTAHLQTLTASSPVPFPERSVRLREGVECPKLSGWQRKRKGDCSLLNDTSGWIAVLILPQGISTYFCGRLFSRKKKSNATTSEVGSYFKHCSTRLLCYFTVRKIMHSDIKSLHELTQP